MTDPPPRIQAELENVYGSLAAHGSMSVTEVAADTGYSYHTARRYLQILIEQNRVEKLDNYGKEKKFVAVGIEAKSYEYPATVWLNGSFGNISNYVNLINRQQDPNPYTEAIDQYRTQAQLFVRLLNEVVQSQTIEGRKPNFEYIISCRTQLYDIADKHEATAKIIRTFLANETLKPSEMFGMFSKDPDFISSIPFIKKAMNIIMGEIVYPEVLSPIESEGTEV